MHLKHHKEAGQHVVWYVGAWFGWKDNTYWPPKSREFGAKAVQWFIDGAVKSTVSLIWLALPICCVCASTFAFNTHLNLLLDLQQCYFSWKRQATNFCRYSGLEILVWCLLLPSIALEVRRDRTLNIVGRRVSIFSVLCQLPNPGPWVKNTGLTS